MKRFENIILSNAEPDTSSLWLKPDKSLWIYNNGWEPIVRSDFYDAVVKIIEEMTAEDKTKLDNLQSTVFGDVKAVDLGLPSGTLWADRNVGASSPEDGGLYFQWGDTQGYTADQVGTGEGKKKFASDFSDYKYSGPGATYNSPQLTKYCNDAQYGKDGTFTDNLTTLELSDDAVYTHMGGSWRMPTEDQLRELLNNTKKTNQDGGILLTSKINSKSIFVPSSYIFNGEVTDDGINVVKLYSTDLNNRDCDNAISGLWHIYAGDFVSSSPRCYGLHVRGVTSTPIKSPTKPLSEHPSDTNNPHKVTKEQVGLSNVTNDAQVKRSEMGVDNGVATLNSSGKLVLEQLPDEVSNYIKDLQDESKTLLRWLNFGKSTINPIIAQAHFTDPDQAFFHDQNDTKIIIPVDENGDVTNYVVPSGTTRMRFEGNTALESIKIYGVQALTNIHCMFDSCSNLKYVNTADWDVSNVTDSEAPFWHTSSLIEADLSNWKLEKSTNLAQFMQDIPALTTLKLDNFNTCGTGVEVSCGDVFYYLPIKEFIAPNWTNFKYLSQKFSIISNMPNLERVVLHSIDTSAECNSKYTSVTHFSKCPKLKKIEVTDSINITKDYDLTGTIVDRNTALLFLQGLNSGVTGKMIKFSPESFSKLTDADKKIATDKGWRVIVIAPAPVH